MHKIILNFTNAVTSGRTVLIDVLRNVYINAQKLRLFT